MDQLNSTKARPVWFHCDGLISVSTFQGRGDADRSHASGGCGLDAHFGVFKNEAVFRSDADARSADEEGFGRRFAVGVIFRADEDGETIEKVDSCEGFDDGFARAAGYDGKGDFALHGVDVFEDLGDGLERGQKREVEVLLVLRDDSDGHVEAVHLIQRGDNFDRRLATPGIEKSFVKGAIPLGECLRPGDVVEGHGVGDGAVAVEEITAEVAGGDGKGHVAPCRR